MEDEVGARILDRLDEIASLLAALATREAENRSEAARQLHGLGFPPPRIAMLLGMKADTVRKAVGR